MKGILLDENLPDIIRLPTSLPITHSRQLGAQWSDAQLWEFAGARDLVIVSKDADFSARIKLQGPPPRVVHVRVGNMRRAEFVEWFSAKWPLIEELVPANKLIDVYSDHMELMA